ncbi:DUF2790 domain-containing protein [Pseudomonas sp. dw_358]|uniref:DUF2790 domain-containing protein n=1 Tax=Pseudomonas sp. dw_358 TaxID=2720083 RepID=UPI001BD2431F|nr:DUF2790 domain-containing protein [Pseudomonas sp. dw_358]
MKLILAAVTALLVASPVFASTLDNTAPIHDKDGFYVKMDIAKVISDTNTSVLCGIQPARLDYLDHAGREHVLNYKVEGLGCTNDS